MNVRPISIFEAGKLIDEARLYVFFAESHAALYGGEIVAIFEGRHSDFLVAVSSREIRQALIIDI